MSGWPDRLRWSLVDGCADFGVAQRRTEVLAAATRSEQGTRNGGYFVHNAKILLSCWLHAAALEGLGTRDVVRWAPELPKLMSLAGGFGIFILASLQNLAAAEQRWGRLGVRQMFANATVKLVLGGVGDPRELKMRSEVIGDHDQEQLSVSQDDRRVQLSTSTRRSPILDPGALRTMPEGTGVLIHRTTPATRVRFVPAHCGPRAADIAEATHRALQKVTATTWAKP